jgi:acyl dehydratase
MRARIVEEMIVMKRAVRWRRRLCAAAVLVSVSSAACDESPTSPTDSAIVAFNVAGETFRAELVGQRQIEAARAAQNGGPARIPNGRIVAGAGVNQGWSWHIDDVEFVEVTIELCDGRPSGDRRLSGQLRSHVIHYTSPVPNLLYLQDLQPGLRFVTETHTVTEDEILRFAGEFDPQPFHLDHAAARATLFKGLAGSGWHTAALTMRLMVNSGPPLAGGILGVGGEIAWSAPMRPGDTLRVHSEVVDVTPSRSRPERGLVTMRNETRNQRGEAIQIFVAKLVVPRRPDP